jgi:hypothetical protein
MFAPSTAAVTPLLVYVGVAGAAGIVAVVTRPRAVPTVLLTVGLLGFALACGDKLPLLPALVELPGFGAFRIAGHYLTLFAVGGILAGVMGLAALTQAQGRSRWRVLAVVLLVLAGFTIAADDPRPMTVLILALGTGLVVGLAWAPPVWRPRIGWMLVGLTVVDLFFAGRRVAEILQPLPQAEPGRILAGYADPHGHTRVADFEWAGHRIGPREGVRDLIGHRPALTDERYMMMYRAAPHSVELLRAMNVGVVGFSRFARATRTGKLDPIAGHERLYRVPDPWPMAWWTDDIVVVETPAEALASLRRHQQPIAVFESADLPPGVTAARGPEPPARPRVVELGLSRLVFEIDVPASGVFVISEAYADGWTAWVDGSPVTIHRANMIARALPMSPGAHRVELEYAPAGVRSSWWLWLATWATLLVVASFRRRYASRVRATP